MEQNSGPNLEKVGNDPFSCHFVPIAIGIRNGLGQYREGQGNKLKPHSAHKFT